MPLDDTSYQRVLKLHENYNAQLKAIRTNDNLSHTGKQRALAKAWVDHDKQIKDIRQKANEAYTNRDGYLRGELFGFHGSTDPHMALSMRDAMARVAAIETPAQARQLFQQAHLTGDEPLRRAIAATAFSRRGDSDLGDHWASVFNDYIGTQDERRQGLIAELDNLQQAKTTRAKVQENFVCNLSRPSELSGVNDLAAVASGAIDLGDGAEGNAA